MNALPDGGEGLPSLSLEFSPEEADMDLTMCGLLPERAEELARLYREYGSWNEVKDVWFEERLANRSTKGSSQKIFSVLTSRFKNAPPSLPNPRELPVVLDACETSGDKSQVLYAYLVADDVLVRYVVHEYIRQHFPSSPDSLDFSNETLTAALDRLEYEDGSSFDYAESTTKRWCEGFRSVMREIGVLGSKQALVGDPPPLGDTPLLVAMGFSYEEGEDEWFRSPMGLLYLFQPNTRWEELYYRAAGTEAWEFVELHGSLQLRPTDGPYSWITSGESV